MSIIRHENELRALRNEIESLKKRVDEIEAKPKPGRPPKTAKQEKSA